MGEPKNIHAIAQLARAEGRAGDGVLSASIQGGGLAITPAVLPDGILPPPKEKEFTNEGILDSKGKLIHKDDLPSAAALNRKAEELGYTEEMTETDLDERTEALQALITSKMRWEREQIVAVIENYARDCDERCEQLLREGKTARKKYRKENQPDLGDQALEENHRRAAAFRVRMGIALDLANKVSDGWGRKRDGTPQ